MPIQGLTPEEETPPPADVEGQAAEPQPLKEEDEWQLFAQKAIDGLYPNLKAGEDYLFARAPDEPTSEPRLLKAREGITIDEGAVRELAQKLADAYRESIKPKPGLHTGTVKE